MQLNLQIEGNYNIKDLDSGRLFEWPTVVSGLPWRHNQLAPHEPRMPPHEYVLRDWCEGEQAVLYEVAGFAIDSSPKSYDAYFRAYQRPMKYMEVGTEPGDFRYWRTSNLQPAGHKDILMQPAGYKEARLQTSNLAPTAWWPPQGGPAD